MGHWLHKIELRKVLDEMCDRHDLTRAEDDCPEEVKEAIAKELEKAPPLAHFAGQFRRCRAIAAVNRLLEKMYDEADRTRVWCGI